MVCADSDRPFRATGELFRAWSGSVGLTRSSWTSGAHSSDRDRMEGGGEGPRVPASADVGRSGCTGMRVGCCGSVYVSWTATAAGCPGAPLGSAPACAAGTWQGLAGCLSLMHGTAGSRRVAGGAWCGSCGVGVDEAGAAVGPAAAAAAAAVAAACGGCCGAAVRVARRSRGATNAWCARPRLCAAAMHERRRQQNVCVTCIM